MTLHIHSTITEIHHIHQQNLQVLVRVHRFSAILMQGPTALSAQIAATAQGIPPVPRNMNTCSEPQIKCTQEAHW
uniref:Uncharacterized protein n=1 Tax=Arundo donax TaxID=35708 RepID=A0A0A9F2F3_ARUDO